MKILFAVIVGLFSVAAQAGSVDVTCAEARASYWAHGRIYVRTNGDDIVPIYGLIPTPNCSQRRGEKYPAAYWVQTTDNKSCVLGFRCLRNK